MAGVDIERPKLFPGEAVLFMHPNNFVFDALMLDVARGYYTSRGIVKAAISNADLDKDGKQIMAHFSTYDIRKVEEAVQPAISEVGSVLNTLVNVLSHDRVKLINNQYKGMGFAPFDRAVLAIRELLSGRVNDHYPGIQTLTLPPKFQSLYPRDLVTYFPSEIGSVTFVDFDFPRSSDKRVIASPFSEGGMILQAGKSVLTSEEIIKLLQMAPSLLLHIDLLKELDYQIGIIPTTRVRNRQPDDRLFVPGHIDGHASLLLGTDQNPYFLAAESYVNQNRPTQRKLTETITRMGINFVPIPDGDLSHLAFNNILQLRDNSVIYIPSGKWVEGNYEVSFLDKAVDNIVGADNVIPTHFRSSRGLNNLSRAHFAGLRCMSTIILDKVFQELRQSFGQAN